MLYLVQPLDPDIMILWSVQSFKNVFHLAITVTAYEDFILSGSSILHTDAVYVILQWNKIFCVFKLTVL